MSRPLRRQSSVEYIETHLPEFVRESNRIEGIDRDPTRQEIDAHRAFLALRDVRVTDLAEFVSVVAGAKLRLKPGMDVRVGSHLPPPGGAGVQTELGALLGAISEYDLTPYEAHLRYETLHPFMDGNGRSGRVLWAWMMKRDGYNPFSLPFLHRWYYQSLDGGRDA